MNFKTIFFLAFASVAVADIAPNSDGAYCD